MADSVLFDGVDDSMSVTPGDSLGLTMGNLSLAAIIKRGVDNTYDSIILGKDSTGSEAWNMKLSDSAEGNHLFGGNGATDSFTTSQVLTADGWELIAVTKATGTVTPNFHRYIYGTSTWLRQAGTVAIANGTGISGVDAVLAFGIDNFNSWFSGNLLIAGVWNRVLTNSELDGMTLTQQSWIDATPKEAWRFDSTSSPTRFVGTSVNAGTTGGPTLDTGDVPAGWTDIPPPPPPTGVVARPDYSKFPKYVLAR